MMLATILLLSLGAVLLLVWAFSAFSIIVALRRADRARLARFPTVERVRVGLRTLIMDSMFLTINTVTFVAASGWCKLRGKRGRQL